MAPRLHRCAPVRSPPRVLRGRLKAAARLQPARQASAPHAGAAAALRAPLGPSLPTARVVLPVAPGPSEAAGGAGGGPAGQSCTAVPRGSGSALGCPHAAAVPRGVQANISGAPLEPGPAVAWSTYWGVVDSLSRAAGRQNVDMMTALSRDRRCSFRHPDGAPPREVLQAMAEARAQGADLLRLADTVVESRFLCKTVPSTLVTYASHLRMVAWASELLGEPPLGCSVQHIRRVAAVCACASTQHGWLSAWALAHQVAGVPWQGDQDVILKGIRLGTSKCRTPRLLRQKVDRRLLRRLLRHALAHRGASSQS